MIRFRVKRPNLAPLRAEARRRDQALVRAAGKATDTAIFTAKKSIQMRMRSAGLGRLDRVVGATSSLRKNEQTRKPWGVIYAKGKTNSDSRGAGALEAYAQGANIRPKADLFSTGWLWIPQRAIPRTIRRFRTTPALYNRSGYATSIGPLIFKQIASNKALLVIRRVTLSVKNGRARRAGKRPSKTRINAKEIVAFVGIKNTRRGKRFDRDSALRAAKRLIPSLTKRDFDQAVARQGAIG